MGVTAHDPSTDLGVTVMLARSAATLSIVALATLGLAACTAPSTSSGGGSDAPASPTPSEEAVLSGPECLIGEWQISESEMTKFYNAVGEATGTTYTITGDTGLTFTADEFSYTPDFAMTMTTAGVELDATISGAISGTYEAADDVITTDVTSSDARVVVTLDGVEQDVTEQFGDAVTGAPFNNSPYTCNAEGPLIGFDIGSDAFVELQLTRP